MNFIILKHQNISRNAHRTKKISVIKTFSFWEGIANPQNGPQGWRGGGGGGGLFWNFKLESLSFIADPDSSLKNT